MAEMEEVDLGAAGGAPGPAAAPAAVAAPPAPTPPPEEEADAAAAAEEPDATAADQAVVTETSPYSAAEQKLLRKVLRLRALHPERVRYTETGDLEMFSKTGALDASIPLRGFLPLDTTERDADEQRRLDALGAAEAAYERALVQLREAHASYRLTGTVQPVLRANQIVMEADMQRNRARSGLRDTSEVENPREGSILFDRRLETRKLLTKEDEFGKEVYRLYLRDFTFARNYGKYVPNATPAEVAGGAAGAAAAPVVGAPLASQRQLRDGRLARVFYDADENPNSFLSPMYPVEFTFRDTRYFTALQAFEAERAKEIGRADLRTQLLQTRSARTVRLLTKKVDVQPKDVRGLWLEIFTAVYQQHPELKEQLLATGTDALVFADSRAGPSGIGIGEKDRGVLDPSTWKGENAVGLALETVRTRMREGTLAEAPEDEDASEAVVTEEEQKAAKVGAIINAARRR